MKKITVRVPASTSNLGPGFDCLGVALRLYNYVTLWRGKDDGVSNFMRQTGRRFFAAGNCCPFVFSCTIRGDVPIARGLGSSASVRLGLLHALNELTRANLSRRELFVI